jgi:hypothetical protein
LDPHGLADWSEWPGWLPREVTPEELEKLIKQCKDPKKCAELRKAKKIKEQAGRLASKLKNAGRRGRGGFIDKGICGCASTAAGGALIVYEGYCLREDIIDESKRLEDEATDDINFCSDKASRQADETTRQWQQVSGTCSGSDSCYRIFRDQVQLKYLIECNGGPAANINDAATELQSCLSKACGGK